MKITPNLFEGKSMATWVGILTFLSFTILSITHSYASVVNAVSCNASDVQTAINNAKDGDSVSIPSGNCTWTTGVTINGSSRSLNVYGVGQGSTIITLGSLGITLGSGKLFQMHDMTFKYTGGATAPLGIQGNGGADSFRIHHIGLNSTGATSAFAWFYFSGMSYGVLDHLTATGTVEMVANLAGGSPSVWGQADGPGTRNAVFIEDSTFNWTGHNEGNPVMDSQNGGRYVFRHNTGSGITFGNHGADSGNGTGGLLAEIYNNTITLPDYGGGCTWNISGGGFRSGQVIIYNNTWNVSTNCQFGGWGPGTSIRLSLYRSSDAPGEMGAYRYTCATGNELKFCSQANFSTIDGIAGKKDCKTDADCGVGNTCKWKLCSGSMNLCTTDGNCPSGETCSRYVDGGTGATSGHPCFMAPGMGINNLQSPCYQWNNTMTGSADGAGPITFGEGTQFLTAGVDYYNDTQKPGYTPYVYPHPLNTSGPLPPSQTIKIPEVPGSIIIR